MTSKKTRVVSLAAIVAAAAVLSAAGPARADNGDRNTDTTCGGVTAWQSPATGTPHAQLRFCNVHWFHNIIDNTYSQTVKFEFRDSLTDGRCANARIDPGGFNYSECNAVWKPVNRTLSGRHSSITVTLSYGGISPVLHTQSAPGGF